MLRLHNTLTRNTEDFEASDADHVTLYTCGPTVYSEPQLGNWVAYIRWDTLVRTLSASGYHVERVMNITDVGHLVSDADDGEDKMEKGARREGLTAWDVAEKYTNSFLEGMTALNLQPPEVLAKATEHIDQQIALIKTLEDKGYTYRIDDGIYFDTAKFPTYADFARLDLTQLRAGARVEANDQKKQPWDFALWKFSPAGEQRDMEWDSPWGKGFPGWHIECSAMAMEYLGDTLDIHTGGIDHIPVHHSNEIAQSEAASGQRFANYWLHANFLLTDGRKASKSLGNSYTLADLAGHGVTPLDFRMFVLQSHYRTESNFTWDNIQAAHNRLTHWRQVAELRWQIHDTVVDDQAKADSRLSQVLDTGHSRVMSGLQDDLNTPEALQAIDEVFDRIENSYQRESLSQSKFVEFLEFVDDTLGLKLLSNTPDIDDSAKLLLQARALARQEKNWAESDRLRDELAASDITVLDTASGQRWQRAE